MWEEPCGKMSICVPGTSTGNGPEQIQILSTETSVPRARAATCARCCRWQNTNQWFLVALIARVLAVWKHAQATTELQQHQ